MSMVKVWEADPAAAVMVATQVLVTVEPLSAFTVTGAAEESDRLADTARFTE